MRARSIKRRSLAVSLAVFALTGCGSGDSPAPETTSGFYKYVGSLQCTGGGTPLPAMERQLRDADVRVLASACGSDGKVYAAVCGNADGRIGIFEIPAGQAQAASAVGFAPLSDLPSAVKVACP